MPFETEVCNLFVYLYQEILSIKQQDNYNRKIKAWSSGPGNNTRTVQESSSNTTPIYGARGQPQGFKTADSYNYEMTAVTEF